MSNLIIDKKNCIGVFDSGVGGVGVLKELVSIMPHENFIYYGDSLHAPYGEKTPEQVIELVKNVVNHLLEQEVKAIVIACNTATSVAASVLREKYPEMSIFGMEPALKMAISSEKKNKVLVMATPVTLHLDKYLSLQHRFETQADITSVECPGLAKMVETGNLQDKELYDLLESLLGKYKGQVDNVVLGCTHYPFVKRQIKEILGNVPVFDGGKGTASQVKRVLEEKNLLNDSSEKGQIIFESSKETEEEIEIYRRLYSLYEI